MRSTLLFSSLGLLSAALIFPACSGDEPAGASTSGAGGAATTSTNSGGGGDATTTTTSSSTSSTTGAGGAGGAPGTGGAGGGGQGGAPLTAAGCFADDYVNPLQNGPDYDQSIGHRANPVERQSARVHGRLRAVSTRYTRAPTHDAHHRRDAHVCSRPP